MELPQLHVPAEVDETIHATSQTTLVANVPQELARECEESLQLLSTLAGMSSARIHTATPEEHPEQFAVQITGTSAVPSVLMSKKFPQELIAAREFGKELQLHSGSVDKLVAQQQTEMEVVWSEGHSKKPSAELSIAPDAQLQGEKLILQGQTPTGRPHQFYCDVVSTQRDKSEAAKACIDDQSAVPALRAEQDESLTVNVATRALHLQTRTASEMQPFINNDQQLAEEVKELKQELANAQGDEADMQQSVDEHEARKLLLEQERMTLGSQLACMEEAIVASSKSLALAKEQEQFLKDEQDCLRQELYEASETKKDTARELADANTKNLLLKNECELLRAQATAAREAAAVTIQSVKEVHSEERELNNERKMLQEQLVSIRTTEVDACQEVQKAQQSIQQMQQECQRLLRELADAQTTCAAAQLAVEEAQKAKQTLEEQHNYLGKELANAVHVQEAAHRAAENAHAGQGQVQCKCKELQVHQGSFQVQDTKAHHNQETMLPHNRRTASQSMQLQESSSASLTSTGNVSQSLKQAVQDPEMSHETVSESQNQHNCNFVQCKTADSQQCSALHQQMSSLPTTSTGITRQSWPSLVEVVAPQIPPATSLPEKCQTVPQKGTAVPVTVMSVAKPRSSSCDTQGAPVPPEPLTTQRPFRVAPPGSFTPTPCGNKCNAVQQPLLDSNRQSSIKGSMTPAPVGSGRYHAAGNSNHSTPRCNAGSRQAATVAVPVRVVGSPPMTSPRVVGPATTWRQCPLAPQDPRQSQCPLRSARPGRCSSIPC